MAFRSRQSRHGDGGQELWRYSDRAGREDRPCRLVASCIFPRNHLLRATIRHRLQSRDSASRENGSKVAADTRRSGENYLALEKQVKQSEGKHLNRCFWIAA